MKKKWIRKILKIIGVVAFLVLIALFILGYRMFSPKSDKEILEMLTTEYNHPNIEYVQHKDKSVRVIYLQKSIDTTLSTIVFIHGSPGSSLDFKRYLRDFELNNKYNLIAYDRIGYGENYRGEVVSSLKEEVDVLHNVVQDLDLKNVILAGYSYGGTTALASDKKYKKKILFAAAVKGDLEPMFWAMKLYQWKLSRFLVPKVFQAATIEKLRHLTELIDYENRWNESNTEIISVHGKLDRIVPYQNSIFLENKLDPNKFTLITLENGRHELIWRNFDEIKNVILNVVQE